MMLCAVEGGCKRKVLLVDGARQIGKTFLIEEFARNEYASYIKIDFLNDARAVELLGKAQGRSSGCRDGFPYFWQTAWC